MDLRLLGPVELRLGDGPVELGPRKQRAVLAMLALRAGRTVPTDALIEGLWGEDPPASATKMLQLYVSHLRPLLDGNGAAIVTHGRGYALHLGDDEVDAARAERLVEQDRPRDALALWHGDALEDVADEPFAAARDPPPRGAAAAGVGVRDRRRPRGRAACRRDRRARRARRRVSAA